MTRQAFLGAVGDRWNCRLGQSGTADLRSCAALGKRPVAIVSDAADYVGPALSHLLARTHDLVLGEPADDLVAEAQSSGQ